MSEHETVWAVPDGGHIQLGPNDEMVIDNETGVAEVRRADGSIETVQMVRPTSTADGRSQDIDADYAGLLRGLDDKDEGQRYTTRLE